MEIFLTAGQVDELTSLARRSLPNESCAFLLGKNEMVIEILPMRNSEESAVSFGIEPQEVLDAYHLAESKELQVIGIFHSHPARPYPSSTDRTFMEINPVVWLIYSTSQQFFKAFVHDGDVREVAVTITA
jgi:proteasome lid subunit RPN8/RPN11